MTTQLQARPRPVPPTRRIDPSRAFARRARRADLLVILLWASGAVAAALFLAAGGMGQFGSLASTAWWEPTTCS